MPGSRRTWAARPWAWPARWRTAVAWPAISGGVAEEYVDNDLSAWGAMRRPAYEGMLDDLAAGRRDGVVVYHQDRLTRRPSELEHFVDVLTKADVGLVQFVAGAQVDVASGDGLLVLRVLGAVAANEPASKSRRVRRKLDEVAAAGRPHAGSRRPFGFEDDASPTARTRPR